jgi:hypothetical protein
VGATIVRDRSNADAVRLQAAGKDDERSNAGPAADDK